MSDVVQYREDVIEAIRANDLGLRSVDWYDALFDETDIEEWLLDPPCAFVAVRNISSTPNNTGEMNLAVDMLVTVICHDQYSPRDADKELWTHLETIAKLVQYNKFGNVNAAVTTNLKMNRLRDPALRREGIAFGIVEWSAGLTIGDDYTKEEFFVDENGDFINMPSFATVDTTIRHLDGTTFDETTTLTNESEP